MGTVYASFADTVRDIVGGFTSAQMIAIGIVALFALALGFFIGALSIYGAGVRKGVRRGISKAVDEAKRRADEKSTEHSQALREERKKAAAIVAKHEAALEDTQEKLRLAEKSKEEAEQAALAAERSKEEAEQAAREAEEKIRALREKEESGETIVKERKKKIELLTKGEILDFAGGLNEYLPANVYERGGEDLPDSCRVGICTFLIVYERKGMVKLVLRLHKKTAAALAKQFTLFKKAVYPKGGDWYRWILSSEVTDLDVVTAAIRMAYKYVYMTYYDDKTGEFDADVVNKEENRINEQLLKYKDIPDRDFIVASDAAEGDGAAYSLYGKKEMSEYCLSLREIYPVSVSEGSGDLSPNTFKVADKTFLMAYEKDGVAKMVFRMSEENFALLQRKHKTAEISPFPKATGYHWYVAYIDETFSTNAEIEEIIRFACAHVYDLTNKKSS